MPVGWRWAFNRNMIRTPNGRIQPVGYLQSVVELNPGQPETSPYQRLERGLNQGQLHVNPTPYPLDHDASSI